MSLFEISKGLQFRVCNYSACTSPQQKWRGERVLKREKEVGGGAGQGKVVNKESIGGTESLKSPGFSLAEL